MTVVATVLAGLAVRSPGTSNSELSSLGEDSDLRYFDILKMEHFFVSGTLDSNILRSK